MIFPSSNQITIGSSRDKLFAYLNVEFGELWSAKNIGLLDETHKPHWQGLLYPSEIFTGREVLRKVHPFRLHYACIHDRNTKGEASVSHELPDCNNDHGRRTRERAMLAVARPTWYHCPTFEGLHWTFARQQITPTFRAGADVRYWSQKSEYLKVMNRSKHAAELCVA